MSDFDEQRQYQGENSDPIPDDNENENEAVPEEDEAEPPAVPRRKAYDEDDEDDDEEEDEDDDDEDPGRKRKRAKHRHKRAANPFIDLEAEVTDEDEDEEEDEEEGHDAFIAQTHEGDEEDMMHRSRNALLDRKRDQDFDEGHLEKIAQDFSKRYRGRGAVRYTGDMNDVPQRLLMPSVHDASLWQVRVKPGKERDIVFSLMRKSIDVEYTANPLEILSAFERDSLPGMIYVEARSAQQVNRACQGLVGVYPSRGIHLVPIEEMASLLQIKKQDLTVTPGSWVRIKRGKYQGDLAQVMDITENGEDVGLKFIPRIDLNPRDDMGSDGKKRKKGGAISGTNMRPPQRFFNYEEVVKVYGRKYVSKRNQVYVFQNETYKDGFIEKDFKLSALALENVNPTLDEITRFTRGQDGAEHENNVDLSIIAEASRKAAIAVLQPGDHVEVFEGEQAGVHGVVEEINQDVVTITAVGLDMDGQRIDLPARSVRKRFKPGDHVKVMTGQNADETGLVVAVADNVVTFLSDMSMQEVSVFSKDLREAAEVGSGTNIVGNYELHDLVQLDQQTVGVIFKTERDSFRVLDQNGQVRLVQPHQISMRRDSARAFGTDSQGHELRINDNVKEVDGEARKGRVLHIHQSFFAFLHNREIAENGGIFVTRCRSLASLAPKGNLIKPGTDLSKMNPALAAPVGGMVGSGNMGRGPRDRSIGTAVVVVKGPHKGYAGTIKDTNGNIARVELHTGNKMISIEKEKLFRRNQDGSLLPLNAPREGGGNFGSMGPPSSASRTPNPYANGGKTPSWGATGRTPNPYADGGKTPAWNASARTPNPYTDGGKTPAWNASSRTPNPYASDGGRTPAWNVGSRTPNPYTSGATGSSSGWGGATPRAGANTWGEGEGSGGWGGRTPGRPATSDWGSGDAWGAPTPAAAPTPGYHLSAATPAAAPTPGLTPAGVYHAPTDAPYAPTPGDGFGFAAEDEESSYEPREMWLNDIPGHYQNRVYVKVKGTRPEQFYDGKLENLEALVKGMILTQENMTPVATVAFSQPPEGVPESATVPIKYLMPLQPKLENDMVLVLEGKHKGKVLIVRERPDGITTVVSEAGAGSLFYDIRTDFLVMMAEE